MAEFCDDIGDALGWGMVGGRGSIQYLVNLQTRYIAEYIYTYIVSHREKNIQHNMIYKHVKRVLTEITYNSYKVIVIIIYRYSLDHVE